MPTRKGKVRRCRVAHFPFGVACREKAALCKIKQSQPLHIHDRAQHESSSLHLSALPNPPQKHDTHQHHGAIADHEEYGICQ